MCAYKLCRVEFKYWGMQAKIELDRMTWILDWVVILANLALVLLLALPGTTGPNRFGPDPRRSAA